MKKSKKDTLVFIGLIGLYIVIWLIQFFNTMQPNAQVAEFQETLRNIQDNLNGLTDNPSFPKQLIGDVKSSAGRLDSVIGPLNAYARVDVKGSSGIISQFTTMATVLLVLFCGKPGFITATTFNVLGSLYTLIMAVIIRGNTSALPGVAIPLLAVVTNAIIFFYIQKSNKMHAELNESYEQAIENNRIIQEKDEVLSYLAYYDRLTQMPNRHLFMENIEERVTNGEEYSIIYADIDNFRHINDSFGHSIGDELLVKFAQRIEGICGEQIFAAKIGGDEYGFVLPAVYTQDDIVKFINKLQGVFGEVIEIKGDRFSLTASFGAASFPSDARSSEDLFRCAETAMFAAKTNGKNQLCFYTSNRY